MSHKKKQENITEPTLSVALRLWPGVIIVVIQFFIRFIIPILVPNGMVIGVFGGMLGGIAVGLWWAFFSRAPRIERWSAIVIIILALYGTSFLLDNSIATANMGLMFIIYSIPVMSLALVLWAVITRNLSSAIRRVTMTLTILLASGLWILLRTNGMTGEGRHDLDWRWAKTEEEILLAQSGSEVSGSLPEKADLTINSSWPGFRGINRDGVVHGLKIRTNWAVTPPAELWRKQVGPGCSSFAVAGNLFYTQEQRGEFETVSCYDLSTGNPVWKHQDNARFYDSHAGAGPRSTPSIAGNRVYTLGGTGILNALDSRTGSVIWSRDASSDAGIKAPGWGFSASPLVVNDIVIVALAGKLAAYDTAKGAPRWYGPDGGSGYSSPQLFIIKDVPQVLFMSKAGALSVDPATGKKLWEYSWPLEDRILQPALLENGDLLLSEEYKNIRRVSVTHYGEEWKITDIWTAPFLKSVFNDQVIHKGFAYGFDGPYLACVDLKDGMRKWRGGRYQGFSLLLADQDILLVLSEKGELAVVSATSEKFTEFAKFQALKGKTWNHPALAGNIILVRNAQEMAAFKFPPME
jgi:outer membrane protein assembly factor BamB